MSFPVFVCATSVAAGLIVIAGSGCEFQFHRSEPMGHHLCCRTAIDNISTHP